MAEIRFTRRAAAVLMGCCSSPVASRRFFRELGRKASTSEKVLRNCTTSDAIKGYHCLDMDLPGLRLWVLLHIREDGVIDVVGAGKRGVRGLV